jgi:hypothetical protein
MTLDRRSALALLAAGVLPERLALAQHQMHAAQTATANYPLQFFTPDEHAILDRVTEMILPADDHAPGASAARVADFIDLFVANSGPAVKRTWRAVVQAFAGGPDRQRELLQQVSLEEESPRTEAGRFFVNLKRMTLHAYYTSEIGLRRELGYRGPEVLGSFPGCKA